MNVRFLIATVSILPIAYGAKASAQDVLPLVAGEYLCARNAGEEQIEVAGRQILQDGLSFVVSVEYDEGRLSVLVDPIPLDGFPASSVQFDGVRYSFIEIPMGVGFGMGGDIGANAEVQLSIREIWIGDQLPATQFNPRFLSGNIMTSVSCALNADFGADA